MEEKGRVEPALRELRAALEDVAGYKELEQVVGTDDRLSRFIISRRYDVAAAKEMVMNHLTWRKENDLETWRQNLLESPFLLRSFPNHDQLHAKGFGMVQCAIHAGKSRFGEAVYLEVLGGEKQSTEIADEEEELIVKQLIEYYLCFLEKRSLVLEELSKSQGRRVCTVQVREVSRMSFMPKSGAFAVVQRIMSMGMLNYPESASVAFFVNPPSIFMAVFAIVKRWLPEETNRKFKFVSKLDMASELLKYLRPRTIAALDRLEAGENGDALCEELLAESPTREEVPWRREIEKLVPARDCACLFFAMDKESVRRIAWERLNPDDSPKSTITATLSFVDPSVAVGTAEDVLVKSIQAAPGENYLQLPAKVDEAIVMLCLDHRTSWITAHTFKLRVMGST